MKYSLIGLLCFLMGSPGLAQDSLPISEEIIINEYIEGTLLTPASEGKHPLVVFVQDAGAIDRNGNQSFMKNDAFKKLARALAEEGIASYRYDKRIFNMRKLGITEEEIRFDDFVTDLNSILDHFEDQERFEKLIVLGHGQGSLIGMLAAQDQSNGFISIAGPSKPIDELLVEQVGQQMPGLKESTARAFKEMREQGSTSNYDPVLSSIFNPRVQPFMLSWMKYDPAEEIAELEIPVLIVNGTQNLQVSEEETEQLHAAKPEAEMVILENMNHIFREIQGDDLENSKSANEPNRPLHPELVPVLVDFIKGVE